jgi:hypothetical protein
LRRADQENWLLVNGSLLDAGKFPVWPLKIPCYFGLQYRDSKEKPACEWTFSAFGAALFFGCGYKIPCIFPDKQGIC